MEKAPLSDYVKIVQALPPELPSSSTPDIVSMKNYAHCTVIVNIKNGGGATGSAITLKQSTDVAGTDEKALGFDEVKANIDTAATDTLVDTVVVSDTFTTDSTNSKNLQYVIEIPSDSLDADNDFDCLSVDIADATDQVAGITYVLSGARYKDGVQPSAILD